MEGYTISESCQINSELCCCWTLHTSAHSLSFSIVDSTMYITLSTIQKSAHTISCCYCSIYSYRVSYSLHQALFKELVTLYRKNPPTKQQMFWQRITTASFGLITRIPGITTPQITFNTTCAVHPQLKR